MYQFMDATKNFIGGECEHHCSYCYVESQKSKPVIRNRYSGDYRLIEHEFKENLYKYGEGITIFVQNMGDLFAEGVPDELIKRVLEHLNEYPKNTYLLQSKNPMRFEDFRFQIDYPPNIILVTTIETNLRKMYSKYEVSKAPLPYDRVRAMWRLKEYKKTYGFQTAVTIEPILKMNVEGMIRWMKLIEPDFVTIGADSKNTKDIQEIEPDRYEVEQLINGLNEANIEIMVKSNLDRLKGFTGVKG